METYYSMKCKLVFCVLFLSGYTTCFINALELNACNTRPLVPQDRRNDTNKLRVATFNVKFLFGGKVRGLKCPGPDCDWKNEEMAIEHVNAVAKVIMKMDVDILQLSEVQDCAILRTLTRTLKRMGDDSFKPYVIKGTDTYTGQNVALLTRIDPMEDLARTEERAEHPVADSTCRKSMIANNKTMNIRGGSKGVSKHFYTRFQVVGFVNPITMIGVHFLARPDDYRRCFTREAQATVIANIANRAADNGDDVIVLGDLNDFSDVVPDIKNSQPISGVFKILRNSGNGLQNVASKAPQETRYTNWWDRNKNCEYVVPNEVSSLDHILMSASLSDKISSVKFGHDLFEQRCGTMVSDHFPVIATIDVACNTGTTN